MNETKNKVAPPTMTVENIVLERFEALVYSRKYEEAGQDLLKILFQMRTGGEFAGHVTNDSTRPRLYTRLAAAIGALLSDPNFQLSLEGYDHIAVEHATLHAIFQASTFGNADYLLHQFGTVDPQNPGKITFVSQQNVLKLMLAYSLDSDLDLDLESIVRSAPRFALAPFLGMLAQHVVLTPRASARRENLLKLGPLFEQVELQPHLLPAMSVAYMFCSYATSENKHDIKQTFNTMLRRMIESQVKLPELPQPRPIKERPTVLVPIEWFTSLHAMYRCYAPSIRQLKQRFRLVMIGHEQFMDEVSKELFDEVIVLRGNMLVLGNMIEQIKNVAPDIVYYPSVGMTPHWAALASVRLAPIQIATLGHPATTRSEAIDYVVVEEAWRGAPECFSETVIVRRTDSTAMMMRSDAEFPQVATRERPDVLRIAVPSMICKLNAAYLAACQSLASKSTVPLEFHFFPNMIGLLCYQATRQIHNWLPSAVVHLRSDYKTYLQNLSQCDIGLSTFPFGGTNSNIDLMRLAIPNVTLEGKEVHSQSDSGMMRMAGLPEWLVTRTPAEFESAALRLIGDHAERVAVARQLAATDIEKIFMAPHAAESPDNFLHIFEWIYENHERIQQTGRRYWTIEQRRAFGRPVAREAVA